MVKTPPFHGGNTGSNPVRVTKKETVPQGAVFLFAAGFETKHRLSPPKAARSGSNSPVDCCVVEKKIPSGSHRRQPIERKKIPSGSHRRQPIERKKIPSGSPKRKQRRKVLFFFLRRDLKRNTACHRQRRRQAVCLLFTNSDIYDIIN